MSVPGAPHGAGLATRVELALLCALMFAVPLFEVPKQLLWAAWSIAWLSTRGARGLVRPRWDTGDWALAAFAGTAVTAGLATPHWSASLPGAGDAVRVALTAFLIGRGGYAPSQLLAVMGAGLAGALLALAWAAQVLSQAVQPAWLELHSVGHVNHSAIYLGIAVAVAAGLAIAAWRRQRGVGLVLMAAALLLGVSLFVAASRAALGATLVFVALLAWAEPLRAPTAPPRWRFRIAIGGALLGVGLVYGIVQWASPRPLQPSGESLSEKFESRPPEAGVLAFRDRLWRVAALGFLSQPVFGIGNDRFHALTPQSLCPSPAQPELPASSSSPASPQQARTVLIDPCDATRLYFAPHAHSVYANTLAERGALGFTATLALLAWWAVLLVRRLPMVRGRERLAGLWCVALGGWCLSAVAGVLNTTLHHEHGLLAMAAFGTLLAIGRMPAWQRGADTPGATARAGDPVS